MQIKLEIAFDRINKKYTINISIKLSILKQDREK